MPQLNLVSCDCPHFSECFLPRELYHVKVGSLLYHVVMTVTPERKKRAAKIVQALKRMYPVPKTELKYKTPFQLVVAVMLSAQTTDKQVNKVTEMLFKKYKTPRDFVRANPKTFENEISSVSFFRNKAKAIIAAARVIEKDFKGKVPKTVPELVTLPGVAYKTANVVLGELYDIWEGIPTDTHVKRFAHRFSLVDSTDLTKISKELEALVPKKDWKYVNNGLVLYGRYICTARPHECDNHPLTKLYPKAATRWPKAKQLLACFEFLLPFEPFDSKLDKFVDELRIRDAGRFPHLRVHTDIGESRYRINLVDDDPAVFCQETVHASHALTAEGIKCSHGRFLYKLDGVRRQVIRDLQRCTILIQIFCIVANPG